MVKKLPIDINCDMGESLGDVIIGNDEKLMPFISSCNIACGFHGGDPMHMQKTIRLALHHKVRIGAHPAYPDLEGFGRRKMTIDPKELKAMLIYQISALKGMVEAEGGKLSYVKPHGALYNKASINSAEARAIIEAMNSIGSNLVLMGLAGSVMESTAKELETSFIAEAFCDRKYVEDGNLMSRDNPEAVHTQVSKAVDQFSSIVYDHKVNVGGNKTISLKADSICIHGDNPNALPLLEGIYAALSDQ